MEALRVSATDIDALRYFRQDEDSDLSELLAQLRHQGEPSPSMLAGTALHKALENIRHGNYARLEMDGYTFDIEADGEVQLLPAREMKSTGYFLIGDCLVTVVGKVDAANGNRIEDHKFTTVWDAEKFLHSFQWRIYLELFGADEFQWNVFVGRETEERHYVITAIHQFGVHRYPGMKEDIETELRAFVEFARDHLPERFITAGAVT